MIHPPSPHTGFALLRLGLLVVVLAAAAWFVNRADVGEVRSWVAGYALLGAVAWIGLASLLEAALVPATLLGLAGGALYGPAGGAAVNLCVSLLGGLLAWALGRWLGRDGVRALLGRSAERIEDYGQRFGVFAVAVQRVTPVLPDGPSSYVLGAFGIGLRAVVLGTLIGSAPWALGYALVGADITHPFSPLVIACAAVVLVANGAGLVLARRWRDGSGQQPRSGPARPSTPG